jgi:hypothetical protein
MGRSGRYVVTFLLALVIAAPAAKQVQAKDLHAEIVDAAKRMTDIMYEGAKPGGDSGRIAKIACDLLNLIDKDEELRGIVKSARQKGYDQKSVLGILDDYQLFSTKFLMEEENRLKEFGIPYPMALDILSQTSNFRIPAKKHVESFEGDFYGAVERLRDAACALQSKEIDAQRDREIYRGVGAIVLGGVDIFAFVTGGPLGAAIGGASLTVAIPMAAEHAGNLAK